MPPPVDRDLRVTSDQLNGLISSDLEGTVAELERTIRGAGLEPNDRAPSTWPAGPAASRSSPA